MKMKMRMRNEVVKDEQADLVRVLVVVSRWEGVSLVLCSARIVEGGRKDDGIEDDSSVDGHHGL